MAKFTDGDLLPEDDPVYDGTTMIFTIRRPKQLIESQVSEAFAAPVAAPKDRENKAATASGRKK